MSISEGVYDFVEKHYNSWEIVPINAGGSSREYFRIKKNDDSRIICRNERIYENERFLELAKKLKEKGVSVPSIERLSIDKKIYVQTDLGDISLLNIRQKNKDLAFIYYKKAIDGLAKIQTEFDIKELGENTFFDSEFDETLIYRDLFYFTHFFLEQTDLEVSSTRLLNSFRDIISFSENFFRKYVMLRDFQGRNIMVVGGDVYFIDFQNAMRGYRMYDLVSLLWQAKANLSQQEKEKLLEYYLKGKSIEQKQDLIREYQFCALLRAMQVLGAYGKLGLIQRKKHFLESISMGVSNLKYISEFKIMDNFPYLKEVFNKLEKNKYA